jgi:hypothetical protein
MSRKRKVDDWHDGRWFYYMVTFEDKECSSSK